MLEQVEASMIKADENEIKLRPGSLLDSDVQLQETYNNGVLT